MIGFEMNAVLNAENPTREDFAALAESIESSGVFKKPAGRFILNREKIGRITLERTKTILSGDIVYSVFQSQYEGKLETHRHGYEFRVNGGKVKRVDVKRNPVFLDGGIELLIFQRRYL